MDQGTHHKNINVLREPMPTIKIINPELLLTDRQKKILALLEQGTLSRQQITDKLRPRVNKRAMQSELTKLKKLGLIESMGAGTTIVWSLIEI